MKNDHINLARSFVLNARRRAMIYRLMLAYLLLSSVLLVFVANRATHKIQEGLNFNRQAQALQKRFSIRYPNQPSMETYAGLLKESLQKKSGQAASINAALPVTVYSILPLLNLLADPAQSGSVNKLYFEQKGKESGKPELVFSVMVPDSAEEDGVTETPFSLQRWRNDPILVSEFTSITPTTTERGNVGRKTFSILKYKAIFREY